MKYYRFLIQLLNFRKAKKYKCPNCHKVNFLIDNKEITVGFCWNCGHPVWN